MGRTLPKVLTRDERHDLLDQFNTRYDSPLRNLCMVRVMLETGLRPGEVVSLKPEHIRDDNRIIVRDGKGDKDRSVWAPGDLLDLLDTWQDRAPDSPWLFPTKDGNQLDLRYMREMVKRCAREAGIADAERVSPMTLRHTFATAMYRETNRIQLVSKALGHEDVSTTMVYTHIVDHEVRDAMTDGVSL